MKTKKKITLLLCCAILCAGCNEKTKQDIPELLEPAASNEAFRPAEYGSIGKVEVLFGTVVPKSYCHYYNSNVQISQIVPEVGDIVEAGDVLAYADVGEAKEELTKLEDQLAYENSSYELKCNISQTIQDGFIYQSAETDCSMSIALEQENHHYEEMLHEYRVKKLQTSIGELKEVIADGTLVAKHSGQVTYTKNLSQSCNAGANENIVIVSDYADKGLELNMNVQLYKFSDYEVKYMIINGEKQPVTEESYTPEELVLSKISKHFPNVRIACPENFELTLGDMYPVYFVAKDIQNVLTVGNDSIYTEGEQTYVYVKNNLGTKEKRYINVGASDDNYTQVTEGLSEGELVYYHSNNSIPATDETYTAEVSDFNIENHGFYYERSDENIFPCTSKYEGTITKIAVTEGQYVNKGDLLCVIDSGEGKAAMAEAQNAITQENLAYQKQIAALEQEIADDTAALPFDGYMNYEIQRLNYQKELETLDHNFTLDTLQNSYNEISSGNDGNGKISIYAPVSGVVTKVSSTDGDKTEPEKQLFQITTQETDHLLVQMKDKHGETNYPNNIADVGEKITVKMGDEAYNGTCIGWAIGSNNVSKGYPYTDKNGIAHLSYSNTIEHDAPSFYVQMEDADFFDKCVSGGSVDFSYIFMPNVVALPQNMIYSEKDPLSSKVYYYVWKVDGENIFKQYVVVDESLKSDGKQVILSGVKPGDILISE